MGIIFPKSYFSRIQLDIDIQDRGGAQNLVAEACGGRAKYLQS